MNLLSSWLFCSAVLWEKGGLWCISVHVHVCLYVKHFSVLCSFTAVISAHPIHSLDNPHHHFHSGSLASPTRSYLHHQVSPWPVGTSMSHSDRANSTGEIQTSRQILIVMEQWVKCGNRELKWSVVSLCLGLIAGSMDRPSWCISFFCCVSLCWMKIQLWGF